MKIKKMLDRISFLRIIKTGFSNFSRNWLLSAAAILVMSITLIIFAILALLFSVSSYSVQTIQERVDVSIYMKKGLGEDRIADIKQDLEQDPLIREVVYVSAQSALEEFKSKHANNDQILAALNEVDENPLLATLRVKANNLEDYPRIAENISGGSYSAFIEKLNYNDNRTIIDRLTKILKVVVTLGISLVAIFSVIAILVMFNTLRLTMYNRREEVEIMRLVGATDWYIRGPFLAEAIMYSVSALVVTGLLLLPVYARVLPQITEFVAPGVPSSSLLAYPVLLAALFATALILSIISTLLAIRKYLKV